MTHGKKKEKKKKESQELAYCAPFRGNLVEGTKREREIERYLLVVRSSEDTISLNEWYRKPAAGGFASRWTLMRRTIYGVNAAN